MGSFNEEQLRLIVRLILVRGMARELPQHLAGTFEEKQLKQTNVTLCYVI